MNEAIENLEPEKAPPAGTTEGVAKRKKKHFATNPFATGKIVRRGVRQQLRKLETLFFTLIGELRVALHSLKGTHEEHEIVLAILCKQASGRELDLSDLAILDEIIERAKEKQPKAADDQPAGSGPAVPPGV